MHTVTLHEAETHLAALLARVQHGERILIERDGQAIAELSPITPPQARRRAGIDKGRMRIADDFDAPLPEAILREFEP